MTFLKCFVVAISLPLILIAGLIRLLASSLDVVAVMFEQLVDFLGTHPGDFE